MPVSCGSSLLALTCMLATCNAYVNHVALTRARENLSTFLSAASLTLCTGTGGASLGSSQTSAGTGIYTNSTNTSLLSSSSAIPASSFATLSASGSNSVALTTTARLVNGTLSQATGGPSSPDGSLISAQTTLVTSRASTSLGAPDSGSGALSTESSGPSSTGMGVAASSLTSATATATAFPSGFSAVQLSDTSYSENTLITTVLPGSSSPTIVPILVDHDRAFGLFGLAQFPNTVFPGLTFPGLPKFPSFSLPCLLSCGGGGGVGAPITDQMENPTKPDPSDSPSASNSATAVSSTGLSSSKSSAAATTGSTSSCSASGTATECASASAYSVGTIGADPFPEDDVVAMTADAINILSGFYRIEATTTATAELTAMLNITIPNIFTTLWTNTDGLVSTAVPPTSSDPSTTSDPPTTSEPPTTLVTPATSATPPTTTLPPPSATAPTATPTVLAVDPANTDHPDCFPIPEGHIFDTHEGAVKEATSFFGANYAQKIIPATEGPVNVTQYLSHGVSSDPFDNNDQGDDQFLASILSVDECVTDGYNLGEPLKGVKCENIMYNCWRKCTGNKGRGGSITAGCLKYNFGTYVVS